MQTDPIVIDDLTKSQPVPEDGILTRAVCETDQLKAVLFTFSAGQELSEHTASMPAVLHFVQGEATLRLGEQTVEARPGTWVYMPPGLKHAIRTKTSVVMMLLLIRGQ